ncbi:3'(2'),5'-bisphosphate nucleotidase CysQ [Roseomonas arctica]|uniref:3'(2'),5'-bisphosphate nucleotidase CysQ n=2 Tax=Plastoroseomonas arctica TaxID=1509237 RepID=A0AAF1JYY1_9PROT|nr:3'(2'),5'-bisphosphate nucleotidase CysQ [Plastoroseomonas arctica]
MEAGAAIERIRAGTDWHTVAKDDGSPVTAADLAADTIIRAGLAAAFPAIPVVSEEDCARPSDPGAVFFLVDPLDGTREFVAGRPDYTVNIALVEHGVPVAGVVLTSADGRLWCGAKGAGATRNGEAIRARPVRVPPVALISRSHREAATDGWVAARGVTETVIVGSSVKFCTIAEGEADVYPRFGPTMAWDTAAGQAVLEAAGGVVLTPEGAPFRYQAGQGWRNGCFIAWGAASPPIAS